MFNRLLYKKILYCILVAVLPISAQNKKWQNNEDVLFFPEGTHFLPLRANHQEAKVGVLYYTVTSNLKVDVGNNMDLLEINTGSTYSRMTFGIEFMAYAYSTSYAGYRLQIDAIDGFFGGNATYSLRNNNSVTYIRFRYIHNSAHLVDGHWDATTQQWIDGKTPIPFTRDFPEILGAYSTDWNKISTRIYTGFSWAARLRPSGLKRTIYFTGFEAYLNAGLGSFFNEPVHPFISVHYYLAGLPKYSGSFQIQAGIKIGKWESKGLNFYASFYNGNNIYNEYYYDKISRFGIGFSVDFP